MDYKRMWMANKEAIRTISKMKCGFFNFKLKKKIAHAKIEIKYLEQEEQIINLFDAFALFSCPLLKAKKRNVKKTKKKKTNKKK